MKIQTLIAATLLATVFAIAACTVPSWVTTVEDDANIAVPIVGSVIDVVDPAAAPIVTAVETAFTALTKTLDTFKASPTATNLEAVQAAVDAVNQNVAALEQAAQVKNSATTAKVTAIVGLIAQLTAEIAAQVPSSAASAVVSASAPAAKAHGSKYWRKQFNSIVKGDTHYHGL